MPEIMGKIHSIQTLGATDGPGVRFAVFLQGCPLRCVCCHNPDTWDLLGGKEMTAAELAQKAERYKEYFGEQGGVTVSGGEPLLQSEFVASLFKECHKRDINTCLDTSGCVLNDSAKELLDQTDLVMLDIKYTSDDDYRNYVGCEMSAVMEFLFYLQEKNKPTWIRQVIIPGLNDDERNINRLKELVERFSCIEKCELLPFKKLCEVKYKNLGIEFPLKDTPEPTVQKIKELECVLNKKREA